MKGRYVRRSVLLTATILGCGFWPASAALAQEISAAAPQVHSEGLEELVVTARKREERVQDVPDSITLFSAKTIEDAGIKSVRDFAVQVPNMSFIQTQNQGTNSINVRGIGQARNAEPPVAVLFDGVQISSSNQVTQELFDVERIEVLKGPQGSLYGRNAIAGAINIVTKQPSNEFEHRVSASVANGPGYKIQAASSGPIVEDKLLYRIAASYEDFDGVIRNVTFDDDADYLKDLSVRGRLVFNPTDRLTLDARAFYSKFDGGSSWFIPLPDGQPNDNTTPVQSNILGTGERKLQDYTLKFDYDADFATLTAISSYSKTQEFLFEDLDWLATPILAASQRLDVKSLSQELRLTSPSSQQLRWVLGAFYLDTKRFIDTNLFLDFGAGNLTPLVNPADRQHNKAIAGFGQASYDVIDDLELTLGLRYDRDKRRQVSIATGGVAEHSFSAWQPKASLSYKWTSDVMTYATAARGFRSGGFNQATASFDALYAQETAWNYEVGFKSSFLGNRLQVNGAAFVTDFKNQHVFLLDAATVAQGIVNIKNTRIKGVELEVRARPTPGLDLSGGVGLMDAKVKDYDGTGLYDGNQAPITYEWSYNVSGQYSFAVGGDYSIVSRVDYSAKGDLAWHVDNDDRAKPHHLVDARISLEAGDRWRLTLFGKNIFNEKYAEEFLAKEYTGLVADIKWPNTPRRYGIEAVYNF